MYILRIAKYELNYRYLTELILIGFVSKSNTNKVKNILKKLFLLNLHVYNILCLHFDIMQVTLQVYFMSCKQVGVNSFSFLGNATFGISCKVNQ